MSQQFVRQATHFEVIPIILEMGHYKLDYVGYIWGWLSKGVEITFRASLLRAK